MTNWRAETFAALEQAAQTSAVRWPRYAEFACLQARGLRKQALAALSALVDELAQRDWASRWGFVAFLYGEVLDHRYVVLSAVAPHPLQQRVLVPTLKEAQQEVPSCAEAYLWLVEHHPSDVLDGNGSNEEDPPADLLRRAIALIPSDRRLRRALASRLLSHVEYSSHHLDESIYLGDESQDLALLAEAKAALNSADAENAAQIAAIDRAESLVNAWQKWRQEVGTGDFPSWCQREGLRPPKVPVRVYYVPRS